MKLSVVSDLHLSMQGLDPMRTDADLVVLAGDVSRPVQAIPWAKSLGKPVLYVPGNHEFYGGSLDGTWKQIVDLCDGSQVYPMQMQERVVQGVRFLGATLWTSFELLVDPALNEQARIQGGKLLRDFSRIRISEHGAELFSPEVCAELHRTHSSWLRERLAQDFDGPTVVITHHAPSPKSIHPRFAGSLLNACFVSDCEYLMGRDRVALWIHGHTHDSFDYNIKGTRVLCNPRGYFKNQEAENSAFSPELVVRA